MSGARTHTLKRPITVTDIENGGERHIASVTLREPIGEDLLLMDKFPDKPMRLTLEMIARLSGLEYYMVCKMHADDIGPLGDMAMPSLGDGQSTGDNA